VLYFACRYYLKKEEIQWLIRSVMSASVVVFAWKAAQFRQSAKAHLTLSTRVLASTAVLAKLTALLALHPRRNQ
jgi:hypothetical protein